MTSSTDVQPPSTTSLYERIGGYAGLKQIVPTVIALHLENPIVGERFRNAKKAIPELERLAIDFFATGLSGEPTYDGLSMAEAHTGMGITAADYLAVLDDILAALGRHGIGQQETAELLAVAYSLKDDIINR